MIMKVAEKKYTTQIGNTFQFMKITIPIQRVPLYVNVNNLN